MKVNNTNFYDQKNFDKLNSKRKLDQPSGSMISSLSQKKIKSLIDEGLSCTIPFEVSNGKANKITSLLHQLAFLNKTKVIKKILGNHLTGLKPVCIDVKDSQGNTPLMLACLKENFEAAFLLLLAGGAPYLENSDGLSAFDFALKSKSPILARLLLNFANSPSEEIAKKFQEKNIPFTPLDDSTIMGCLTSIVDPMSTNIHDLAFEVLLNIFSFLPEDFFSILNVSNEWRELSKDNILLKNLFKSYPYIQQPEQSDIQIYDWLKSEFNRLKNHPTLQDDIEFQKYGNIFSLPFLNDLRERETEINIQEICTRAKNLTGFKAFRTEAEALCKQDKLALFKALRDWEHLYNLEKLCKESQCLPEKKDATYLSKNINEKLKFLQEKIGQKAPGLTSLDLSSSDLTRVPPEIGILAELKELSLIGNRLTSLPSEIRNLTKLEKLYLSNNRLRDLPSGIGNLEELKELRLGVNLFETLPPEISELTKLKVLTILQNQLTSLAGIGNLSGLEKLILNNNCLESLPSEIGKLTNLKHLSIEGNQLTNLPTKIGKLTNLKYLSLFGNRLGSLPTEINELTELKKLCLSENQLKNLSFKIGKLTKLQKLFLSFNQLTSLPSDIGYLTGLKELRLRSNNLDSIPVEIFNLLKLRVLDVGINPLRNVDLAVLNKVQKAHLYKPIAQEEMTLGTHNLNPDDTAPHDSQTCHLF